MFVYLSNETQHYDVFFDNMVVDQTPGAVLEETHYYPFGLVMTGISAHALGVIKNKDKTFQGQKFDDDLGLNWNEFKYRNDDPQTGRFIEIDPLADKYVYNSTYAFSENKVTTHVELEGLEAWAVVLHNCCFPLQPVLNTGIFKIKPLKTGDHLVACFNLRPLNEL